MNKTYFFSALMAVVLIAVLSVGFPSCGKVNEGPEPDDISAEPLMRKWWVNAPLISGADSRYYLEFKKDGTYSYVAEYETINGMYRITEKEKGTYNILGINDMLIENQDATLFKMMVSGSSSFEQWVRP